MNIGIIGSLNPDYVTKLKEALGDTGHNSIVGNDNSGKPFFDSLDCTILLIGKGLSDKAAIDQQLVLAHQSTKRLIGVYTGTGIELSDIPSKFEDYGDMLICWDINKIIAAIRGEIGGWENPDCSERKGDKNSNREEC